MQLDTLWTALQHQLKLLNRNDKDLLMLIDKCNDWIEQIDKMLDPKPLPKIRHSLSVLAKLFNVELPQDQGLDVLIKTLEDIPADLFNSSCNHIARTWKYANTFPPPANFILAIEKEMNSAIFYNVRLRQIVSKLT